LRVWDKLAKTCEKNKRNTREGLGCPMTVKETGQIAPHVTDVVGTMPSWCTVNESLARSSLPPSSDGDCEED